MPPGTAPSPDGRDLSIHQNFAIGSYEKDGRLRMQLAESEHRVPGVRFNQIVDVLRGRSQKSLKLVNRRKSDCDYLVLQISFHHIALSWFETIPSGQKCAIDFDRWWLIGNAVRRKAPVRENVVGRVLRKPAHRRIILSASLSE